MRTGWGTKSWSLYLVYHKSPLWHNSAGTVSWAACASTESLPLPPTSARLLQRLVVEPKQNYFVCVSATIIDFFRGRWRSCLEAQSKFSSNEISTGGSMGSDCKWEWTRKKQGIQLMSLDLFPKVYQSYKHNLIHRQAYLLHRNKQSKVWALEGQQEMNFSK